jgi:hypothetical protein
VRFPVAIPFLDLHLQPQLDQPQQRLDHCPFGIGQVTGEA